MLYSGIISLKNDGKVAELAGEQNVQSLSTAKEIEKLHKVASLVIFRQSVFTFDNRKTQYRSPKSNQNVLSFEMNKDCTRSHQFIRYSKFPTTCDDFQS